MIDDDKALVEQCKTCAKLTPGMEQSAASLAAQIGNVVFCRECGRSYNTSAQIIESQAAEIERLKREVMLQMGWKTEAQNEVERLLDYDEAKANALHNTLNQLANAEQEIERIKDRLGWICAVMDLDDEVTLQWIYTELQALRGVE